MEQLFNNKLFSQIWSNKDDFLADYLEYEGAIDDLNKVDNKYVILTWQLIASKYANTPIRSNSESQFKLSVFGVMFSETPTFIKRLEIQKQIRELTADELATGETSIANQADNPDEEPTTQTMDELKYINKQHVVKQKRSKIQAYAMQLGLLESDLSETYVKKFAPLFARVYYPAQYIYPTVEEGN